MHRFLFLIISFFLFSASVAAKQLNFVQVTDIHLAQNRAFSSRNVSDSIQNLQNAVSAINNMTDVNFVVFTGDNIDSPNEADLKTFCQITKKLNKPYYIFIGNHDTNGIGDLNKWDYMKIVANYDKYQKSSEPYYYFFPNKDFIAVVMDGASYYIPSTRGSYSDEELEWLDKLLDKYKNKEAVIFQHFPLVEPCEKRSHRTKYPEKYLELLARHDNVVAVLSGHYHAETVTKLNGIYHISTPALLDKQYRTVEINYDSDKKPVLETQILEIK